jgi:hypothetical protein
MAETRQSYIHETLPAVNSIRLNFDLKVKVKVGIWGVFGTAVK